MITILIFLALCLLLGIGIAFGRIAYLETITAWGWIRPQIAKGATAVKRLARLPGKIRAVIAQYKHGYYMQHRLPQLKQQTSAGDNWAIAERLNHIKHIRYQEKEDNICG
jgi:hypothetical protein